MAKKTYNDNVPDVMKFFLLEDEYISLYRRDRETDCGQDISIAFDICPVEANKMRLFIMNKFKKGKILHLYFNYEVKNLKITGTKTNCYNIEPITWDLFASLLPKSWLEDIENKRWEDYESFLSSPWFKDERNKENEIIYLPELLIKTVDLIKVLKEANYKGYANKLSIPAKEKKTIKTIERNKNLFNEYITLKNKYSKKTDICIFNQIGKKLKINPKTVSRIITTEKQKSIIPLWRKKCKQYMSVSEFVDGEYKGTKNYFNDNRINMEQIIYQISNELYASRATVNEAVNEWIDEIIKINVSDLDAWLKLYPDFYQETKKYWRELYLVDFNKKIENFIRTFHHSTLQKANINILNENRSIGTESDLKKFIRDLFSEIPEDSETSISQRSILALIKDYFPIRTEKDIEEHIKKHSLNYSSQSNFEFYLTNEVINELVYRFDLPPCITSEFINNHKNKTCT